MEGDAGASRLNPATEDDTITTADTTATPDAGEATDVVSPPAEDENPDPAPDVAPTDDRRPARIGSGWVAAVCVVLAVLSAGAIAGGWFALRANAQAADISRSDDAALAAAKECVAATQAPDTQAMMAAQSKILECSTGDFGVQAGLFSSVIAEAYSAAQATVAVDDLRAAVERHNEDGSVNVLVAVRVRITNAEAADQQVGYRLRATMAYDEGRYRIASLDQVNS